MIQEFTSNFPNKRILIVEDFALNYEVIREMLKMMQCEVDVAERGVDAIELFKNNSYDLIFMDIQLPEMDGYEVTEKIRKIEGKERHTPIIALTANALEGDKEKCIEAGMDDYLSKPIKGYTIEETLNKYLKN